MVGPLSPYDQLMIRKELVLARVPYQNREVLVLIPTFSSGSNYEAFSDAAYDITGAVSGQRTPSSWNTYRLYARVKIIKDTTTYGVNQIVTGFEIGDYLLYFRDTDQDVLEQMIANKDAYMTIDGLTFRPWNDTITGVGQTQDVFIHAKKSSPRFRKTGT